MVQCDECEKEIPIGEYVYEYEVLPGMIYRMCETCCNQVINEALQGVLARITRKKVMKTQEPQLAPEPILAPEPNFLAERN